MHPTISTHTEKSYIPVVVGLMREWGQDPQDVPVCIDRHTPSSEDYYKTPMHGCAMSSSRRCPPQLHTEHVHLQKHVLAFCNATMTEF